MYLFRYFVIIVKQSRTRTNHMTEQRAYLYSLTNRAKETVRLVPAICRVESVYVCGFVCVRMCMGVPVIVVCVSTFAWVTEASGISTLQSYCPTLSHVIISLLHFL